METGNVSVVPPLRLDPQNKVVWRGCERIQLAPKQFSVLQYLMDRREQLVTKDELDHAVWQAKEEALVVGEDSLTWCISQIRKKLRDTSTPRRYIQTAPTYGYKYVGPIVETLDEQHRRKESWLLGQMTAEWTPRGLVGRTHELQTLRQWYDAACVGHPRLIFLTGEPGIGKTALVEAFRTQLTALPDPALIGYGQCIEHSGAGEAYMPILEALNRLGRNAGGNQLKTILEKHAPTWLLQLPALVSTGELGRLQQKVREVSQERMLREIVDAFEVFTKDYPLVLILEDLHWSDASTLEFLAALARGREALRLLVLVSYRPEDAPESVLYSVQQELYKERRCVALPLLGLSVPAIAEYLTSRFSLTEEPAQFAQLLHHQTAGNPLFFTNVVNDLVAQQLITSQAGHWRLPQDLDPVEALLPESIRQLIQRRAAHLSPAEQHILEAASLDGVKFSAAAVAAALDTDIVLVERCCAQLIDHHQFLTPSGSVLWPDGTAAACCQFTHALYQEFWEERVGAGRRQLLHRRIGQRKETAYGARAVEIAAELAVHFTESYEEHLAVQYREAAARNAMARSAYTDATLHLRKALALLDQQPETSEQAQRELPLRILLGVSLLTSKGYADPEVEQTYERARVLSQQVGETPLLVQSLLGLLRYCAVRGQYARAREYGEQCLRLTQRRRDPAVRTWVHCFVGEVLFHTGQFHAAQAQLEQGIALYDPQRDQRAIPLYGQDPKIGCLWHLAFTLWFCGYPDQALARAGEAVTMARTLDLPFSLAGALTFAATMRQFRGETAAAQQEAHEALILATEYGFPQWRMIGSIVYGWTCIAQGNEKIGIPYMQSGLTLLHDTGALMSRSYFLAVLAELSWQQGHKEDAWQAITEARAVMEQTGERTAEVELHRLYGELLLLPSEERQAAADETAAEEAFLTAIAIAQQQRAKTWELRAVISLCRLWRRQGKHREALRRLTDIYEWFTEGFDTKDLREAKALREALSSSK